MIGCSKSSKAFPNCFNGNNVIEFGKFLVKKNGINCAEKVHPALAGSWSKRCHTLGHYWPRNLFCREYVKGLDAKKPVIICGDMNVSHKEIDLKNPKTNTKNAGMHNAQCWGSMTFWCGSGSADPCLWLMDPDPAIFFIDLQDANKKLIF